MSVQPNRRMKGMLVRTNFNANEKFTFRQAPARFASVTDKSLLRLKRTALRYLNKNYPSPKPNSAKAMFERVHDVYGAAYAQLNRDYITRRGNLENAYAQGVAQTEAAIIAFDQMITEHERLLAAYCDKCSEFGYRVPDQEKYSFSNDKLLQYKAELADLDQRKAVNRSAALAQLATTAVPKTDVSPKNKKSPRSLPRKGKNEE